MIAPQQLETLDPQTRQAVLALMAELSAKDDQLQRAQREASFKQALIDKLSHEMAVLKRQRFATTSEKFAASLNAEQQSLLEDTLDADIAEVEGEIERAPSPPPSSDPIQSRPARKAPKGSKRAPRP